MKVSFATYFLLSNYSISYNITEWVTVKVGYFPA